MAHLSAVTIKKGVTAKMWAIFYKIAWEKFGFRKIQGSISSFMPMFQRIWKWQWQTITTKLLPAKSNQVLLKLTS